MSDDHADYHAATNTAAFFDLTGRAQIEITGGDRAKFLHNFCTNDIKRLGDGDGCEAFATNIKGRVLGHIFVFATDTSLWIDTVPGADETLIAHLDRYLITEDAALNSRTDDFGELLITGPSSADFLTEVGIDVNGLKLYGHRRCNANGTVTMIRRVNWLNEPGYLILVLRKQLDDAKQALAAKGIVAGKPETFDALRIEAGFPLYGQDISDDNLAQEVGRTEQAISFTKGCYLGQEPIARIDAMGHVNRQLCGLQLATGPPPSPGAEVFADDNEKPVGQITSAAISPANGLPVALTYLRTQYIAPGTKVLVDVDGEQVAATVSPGLTETH